MAEHYKALTRKYRPSGFDEIVSQGHVSSTLKNAIAANRLSHAYLFSGPRGVGKTTMARVLARAINGVDESIDGEHLNQTLNIVEIDAASNNSVDDARHIREQVRIPPQNGTYKVFIIDEVHMLSKAAFNALLKTLEEPPDYAIFIFATTEPHKVLPTILSRVQRFDFKRLSVGEISARIKDICAKESIQMDEESVNLIARKADGALRDALSLMDQAIALCGTNIHISNLEQALNVIGMDRLYQMLSLIKAGNAQQVLFYLDELLQAGYDMQELVVNLTEYLRNLYIAYGGQNLHLIEATDTVREQLLSLSKAFSEEDILRLLHLCSETQFKLKDAHQPRIQLEIALIKMASMPKGVAIKQLLEHLDELKKKDFNLEALSSHEIAQNDEDSPIIVKDERLTPPETNAAKIADTVRAESTQEKLTEEAKASTTVTNTKSSFGGLKLFVKAKSVKADENGANTALIKRDKPIQITEIQDNWTKWVENLDQQLFSRHLKLLLQHAIPVSLEHQAVVVEVRDAFAGQSIDQNKKPIEQALFNYFNSVLEIKYRVVKPSKDEIEHLDPYEQFMRIQQKEPLIKTIVEVFGAEPEF